MKQTWPGLAILALSVWPTAGDAYEPETHRAIAIQAAQPSVSSTDRVLKEELGISRGVQEVLLGPGLRIERLIGEGAFSEDFPQLRVLNHFHNPLLSWDRAGLRVGGQLGQASPVWQQNPAQGSSVAGGGNWSWQDARRRYLSALTGIGLAENTKEERDRALAETFLTLGHLSHLVQDASVPAHTRNDPHLIFEGYEAWAERARLDAPAAERDLFLSYLAAPVMPPSTIFTLGRAEAPLPIARLVDSDKLDPPGNSAPLTDPALGIAEYTNGNFLSDDTIFVEGFLLPRRESVDLTSPFLEPVGSRFQRYFPKVSQGEAIRHFVAESALYKSVAESAGQPMAEALTLTRRAYRDYGRALLPRAVGYSAALIDYFFRGRLDVDLAEDANDPSILRLTGTNASADGLVDGTLRLYSDSPAGQRVEVPALGSTMVAGIGSGQPLPEARFQVSGDAERFVAVYEGTLGQEAKDSGQNFPGGVIGRVLGGVRVEQVFSDGGRWKVRTPRGVFLLPLTSDYEEVRWGDGDNILIARTALGPGQPSRIVAYEVQRQAGSIDLETVATPDGPEVRLTVKAETVFPFGMSLGTTVEFTQSVRYRQRLVTVDPRKQFFVWNGFFYQLDRVDVSDPTVEAVVDQTIPFSQTIPITLDASHNLDFGTADEPYYWVLLEVGADTAGRPLALVAVVVTNPTTPSVSLPLFGVDSQGARQVLRQVSIGGSFPSGLNTLLVALVDLREGRVLASTAGPTVAVTWQQAVEANLGEIYAHLLEVREGGPDPATVDMGWTRFPLENPGQLPVTKVPEVESGGGILEISVTGWFRDELAHLGFFDWQLESRQVPPRDLLYDCETSTSCHALRIMDTQHVVTRHPLALDGVGRSRPAPGAERFVILATGFGFDRTAKLLRWDPAAVRAAVIQDLPDGFYSLGAPTGGAVLVQSLSPRGAYLAPLDGTQPPVFFPDASLLSSFTLLEPAFLFNVNDEKFYRRQPPLQRTALPAGLVGVGGTPFGDYHAIKVP